LNHPAGLAAVPPKEPICAILSWGGLDAPRLIAEADGIGGRKDR
jgi:hypothetical protein